MPSTLLRQATIVHGAVTEPRPSPRRSHRRRRDRRGRHPICRIDADRRSSTSRDMSCPRRRRTPRSPRQGVSRRSDRQPHRRPHGRHHGDAGPTGTCSTSRRSIERAERAARLMAANGYRAVRTHADTTIEHGLRSIEALVEVAPTGRRRDRRRDRRAVRVAGRRAGRLPTSGRCSSMRWRPVPTSSADARTWRSDGRSAAATEFFLQTPPITVSASTCTPTRRSTPRSLGLVDLADDGARRLRAPGHRQPLREPRHAGGAASTRASPSCVAEAGIGVVALPHTNLFLQGRGRSPMPRGLTAVAALRAAGVERRSRSRQPAGSVQPDGPGLPVRDRRPHGDGRVISSPSTPGPR